MNDFKSQNQGMRWNDIKEIMGTKKHSNNGLLGLANKTCNGDLRILADKINTAFQSMSNDMSPYFILTAKTSILFQVNTKCDKY